MEIEYMIAFAECLLFQSPVVVISRTIWARDLWLHCGSGRNLTRYRIAALSVGYR